MWLLLIFCFFCWTVENLKSFQQLWQHLKGEKETLQSEEEEKKKHFSLLDRSEEKHSGRVSESAC